MQLLARIVLCAVRSGAHRAARGERQPARRVQAVLDPRAPVRALHVQLGHEHSRARARHPLAQTRAPHRQVGTCSRVLDFRSCLVCWRLLLYSIFFHNNRITVMLALAIQTYIGTGGVCPQLDNCGATRSWLSIS